MILLIKNKVRGILSSGEVLGCFDSCSDVYIHVGYFLVDISFTCVHFVFVLFKKAIDRDDLFRLLT